MRAQLLPVLALWLFASIAHPARADDPPARKPDIAGLPYKAREHLASHFDNCDPADARITKAVEILKTPEVILEHCRREPFEKAQLERFAANKVFFIVTLTGGEKRVQHWRGDQLRNNRVLTPERERILRRLYSEQSFTSKPPAALEEGAEREGEGVEAQWAHAAAVAARHDVALDADTLARGRKNFEACAQRLSIGRALALLAQDKHGPECAWAGLWLLSRLDKMQFARADDAGERYDASRSVPDLRTMDARTFHENVLYAVKARHTFAWGKDCTDDHFLQHVLSPRGTGEPLQRWRRHYFEAIEPEVHGLDKDAAADLAVKVVYDFYQYEGDTTWEDFGMLSALAVHEGRCEDCSNVENCMLRAIGLPACQAYTPWWQSGNGNHAWTWVPGLKAKRGDGGGAVKVYVKTWDKLEDVTDLNTRTVDIVLDTPATDGAEVTMHVWNHDDWRRIAGATAKGGKVLFEKVGHTRDFAFRLRTADKPDALWLLRKGGAVSQLSTAEFKPGKEAFRVDLEKACALGEFKPDKDYELQVLTDKGWVKAECERLQTGAIGFSAEAQQLFRIRGEGITDRPFVVEPLPEGEVRITRL